MPQDMDMTDVLRAAMFSDNFPQVPTPEENALKEEVSHDFLIII